MFKRRKFLALLAVALAAGVIYSCNKLEKFFDLDDHRPHDVGFVYTMSNDPNINSILIYSRNANGGLKFIQEVNSGGAGTGSFLEAHGSLALDRERRLLFAVNAGDNSISSFTIDENGLLTLAQTISSRGNTPVSLTMLDTFLYVINDALACGFRTFSTGEIQFIDASDQSLFRPRTQPAQILARPSEPPATPVIMVTQKANNNFTPFPILTSDGRLQPGGSGIPLEEETPFGFALHHIDYIIIANAVDSIEGASVISSYLTTATGRLVHLNTIPNQQTAASGVAITKDEQYALITNTLSNSISSIKINKDGTILLKEGVAAKTGGGPVDITVSNDGHNVYTLNGTGRSIGQYKILPGGRLSSLGEIPGLPPAAAGLVVL